MAGDETAQAHSAPNVPSASSTAGPSVAAGTAAQAGGPAGTASAHPNMHFDTQAGKWMYENVETGEEFEWNPVANAWVPVVDENVVQAQQAAYNVEGVDESAPANVMLARDRRKKRKLEEKAEQAANKKQAKPKQEPRNTAVFVQRLPLDATVDEVAAVFSKAGMILEDADGKPKIKLYSDKTTGERNGDGLIVYYKEDSVPLAVNLFDDSPLRLGEKETMKVAKAEWSHKSAENGDGEDKQQRRADRDAIKKKMQRRAEKLQREAADYDPSYDEKDSPLVAAAAAKALEGRVVVLSHVFTLEELAEDPSLLLDLKEDVREECEGIGKVTNVVLYDKEPDGIVTVKFADPISAQACVLKNNNRFFGGRQLKAWIYDGKTRYQRSGMADSVLLAGESGEDAEQRRLDEFGKWLENEGA